VLPVAAAVLVAAGIAAYVYLIRERQGLRGVGLAVLRTIALGALVLLFVDPVRTLRVSGGAPTVLLDASLSMQAAGGRWEAALDSGRSLAGSDGTILRFAAATRPFDAAPPTGGASLLRNALAAARAGGGPVVVVTDGEIEDAGMVASTLAPGTRFVLLPRDTVPDAALLGAEAPARAQRGDTLTIMVTLGTWGALEADTARLTIAEGERVLVRETLALPPPPGSARRRAVIPPGVLSAGTHVLRVALNVTGDAEPRDDERFVVVHVSEQPAVVVLVESPDWEGRFLVWELADVARTTVRGYARAQRGVWVDMRTLGRVPEAAVRNAAAGAGLLVVRGGWELIPPGRRDAVWLWPAGAGAGDVLTGDWYVTRDLPASPLAGRVAALEWDSLPPLTGVVAAPLGPGGWAAVSARQGRRGAERPVLVGRDSAGMRMLVTTGEGLWRWRFRGGAPREAYRAVLAAGVDWLLAEGGRPAARLATAADVVPRGRPVAFRWAGNERPDSLALTLGSDSGTHTSVLRFDAAGVALLELEPGVYRWSAPDAGARGVVVVEPYSDEYPPRPVMPPVEGTGRAFTLEERRPRERWWWFLIAVLAFAGEWAWRQRRGLP
jgi:hypothetical protein